MDNQDFEYDIWIMDSDGYNPPTNFLQLTTNTATGWWLPWGEIMPEWRKPTGVLV